jgi:TolA-binding protein
MMRIAFFISAVLLAQLAASQTSVPQSAQPAPAAPAVIPAPMPSPVQPVLEGLQQTAQSMNSDVSRLRIDKWKTDNATKQQAQEMASSVSRNLTAALPDLLRTSHAQPTSIAAQFKLYHNLTALYETVASLTETAGAFGNRQEYEALSNDANQLDAQRRSLATYLQSLAAQEDTELTRLRAQAQARAAAQAAAAAAPPEKIIVDDEEKPPAKSPAKRKSSTKPSTKKPATTPSQPPPR